MDIESTIKKVLVADLFVEAPLADIDDQESLRDIYGLDSVGFMELRVQCEELFQIEISDDDFVPEHFRTVATLAALVRRLRAEPA
ncbi:acyl carrier protein [Actinomadura roseirufa]|uniref:acyl carrier protein n=1 Tax=Actinomadura roseirufa TaxID=2094049 RepID=UPI0010416775|nr:acyl carrier protein [Actinomadura roseirufa]